MLSIPSRLNNELFDWPIGKTESQSEIVFKGQLGSLNEMFLSRWTAHEQWNITFILLKTRRAEGHQFVNLLPDRHAKFVIIQWITCVVPKPANLLMHSQCALSEPNSSSRKTRKLTVCGFIYTSIYFWRIGIYPRLHLDSYDEKILKI